MPKSSQQENTNLEKTKHGSGIIPFYDQELAIYIHRDISVAFNYACLIHDELKNGGIAPCPSTEACVYTLENGFVILLPTKKMNSTVVHELMHITHDLLEYINVTLSDETDEFYAYTLQRLYELTETILKNV